MVMSVSMYASETWMFKKQDINRLLESEMKCYIRILSQMGAKDYE